MRKIIRGDWLLTRVLNKNDKRLPFIFLKIIKSISGKESGHALKIVSKVKLSKKQEGYLLDICVNIWEDINIKSGTRYFYLS